MASFEHARAALSYIEALETVRSLDELRKLTGQALGKFGFDHFIIAELPVLGDDLKERILVKKWPKEWLAHYMQNNYPYSDPVIRFSRQSSAPFNWSSAPYDRAREPRAHEIMSLARDFGLPDGICVPSRSFSRDLSFSMSGGPQADLSPEAKPALHFMALHAIEVARRLAHPPQETRAKVLTAREEEVLLWAAAGKSAMETAQILNITERTVTAHATNAMNKLGAANKTQAVVRAMQRRFIMPDL